MLRYLETFFRNKWLVTIPALLLLFCGAALALFIPKEYNASARIWTEKSAYFDVPNDNPWISAAQIQSNRFRELINTYTFTRAIVDRSPLGATGTEDEKVAYADKIRNKFYVGPQGENLVSVSFSDVRPDMALAVTQIAIEEYNRITAERSNVQSTEAIALYKERIATYETTIIPRSGKAVADYLEKYPEIRRQESQGSVTDPSYILLKQQADQDLQQYKYYQQQLDQVLNRTIATEKNQQVAFRIMDPPWITNANGASFGKRQLLMFAGASAGLSAGFVALFLGLATELDRTVRYAGDVRRKLQLPVLEVVPDYSVTNSRKARRAKSTKQKRNSKWMSQPANQVPNNL